MKKIILATIALVGAIIVVMIMCEPKVAAQPLPVEIAPVLTHQQEVFRSALEWCESKGNLEAINAKDRDGTPSYYSWQFKPSTFKSLGIKYGVISKDTTDEQVMVLMKNYELQKKIVGFMILDKTTVWSTQFPECVKSKVGYPPK